MKTVRLWIREDGDQPKAIPGDGTLPPGPGLVVDVEARSVREARLLLAQAGGDELDEVKDPQGWLVQRAARRAVKPVARVFRKPDGTLGATNREMAIEQMKKGGDA